MQQDVVTVGVDLAKNVFQVHAIGADGKVLVQRQPCQKHDLAVEHHSSAFLLRIKWYDNVLLFCRAIRNGFKGAAEMQKVG